MVQAMQFAVKLFAISVPIFILLIHFGTPSGIFASVGAAPEARLPSPTTLSVQRGDTWTLPAEVEVTLAQPAQVNLLPGQTGAYVGAPRARGDNEGERLLELDRQATLPAGRMVWTDANQVSMPAGAVVPYGSGTPASSTAAWVRPFGPLAGGSGQPLLFTYSLMIAILCGTMGLPHILVRFYTNPDARQARRTAWLVLILVSLFYLWPPLYGLIGRLRAPQLYTSNLTDTVVLFLPRQLQPGWLGDILSGITAAGAFAAFTATLSGLLVSLAGALGHDIYGRWLRPQSSPPARSRAFRVGALMAGGVAASLGLMVEHFDISILVGWAFAIAASSFFPLLVLGIWWRGLTTAGAALGTAIGGGAATLGIVTTMLGSASSGLAAFLGAHPSLAVVAAQPAILTIPVAFTVMIGVSLLRPVLPQGVATKMLQLHVPDRLGLRRDYIPD
jgi:Na+(H+)/acetate symporter ActP